MAFDLCAPGYSGNTSGQIKGLPVRVFSNQQANALSDVAVDCRGYNAVNVAVYVGGSASATISVEGSSEEGGNYLSLSDPNATQTGVSASESFDCIVGTAWVKVRLSAYASGSFTIVVTPYQSPGMSQVQITNTAAQNLAQYGGVAVGPGNPIDVHESESVTGSETVVNVGTGSTSALGANSSRKYALLINDSDTDIYLSIGGAAVVNAGIRLNALGGAYEMAAAFHNLDTRAITAIHGDVGNKKLLVLEG